MLIFAVLNPVLTVGRHQGATAGKLILLYIYRIQH